MTDDFKIWDWFYTSISFHKLLIMRRSCDFEPGLSLEQVGAWSSLRLVRRITFHFWGLKFSHTDMTDMQIVLFAKCSPGNLQGRVTSSKTNPSRCMKNLKGNVAMITCTLHPPEITEWKHSSTSGQNMILLEMSGTPEQQAKTPACRQIIKCSPLPARLVSGCF